MIHKKVEFKGEVYWLHATSFGFNLSPLDHYTDSGELIASEFHDVSYACIFGNEIVRLGQVIGTIDELKGCER